MAAAPQGYSGDMSLGGATFTLAIDTATFDRGLRTAEASARDASGRIGGALGRGSSAAQGLLYLGQAVDDLQYGFRAIVNNIPQIVLAMGGGAGFAGAVGIAAVALNQVVTHLDEFKAAAESSEPIQKLVGHVEDLVQSLNEVSKAATGSGLADFLLSLTPAGNVGQILQLAGLGPGARAAGRQQAAQRAAGEKAAEQVGKVIGSAAQERGKMFRDALEQYGGGDKLIQDYAERLMRARPGLGIADARGMAAQAIQSGMGGTAMAPNQFGLAFEKVLEKVMMEHDTKILNAAGKENEDRTPGIRRDINRELTEEGKKNEAMMLARLRDEQAQVQKNLAWQQERMAAIRPAQQFGSVRDYLGSVATAGADTARRSLDVQKSMNRNLEKIRDKIEKIGQAKFS
jgi:hypothetical protein